MKNKQHITVLLSRFVAAVSACTRYCIRTLKYTVNKASSRGIYRSSPGSYG
jgi:hypothetical protein